MRLAVDVILISMLAIVYFSASGTSLVVCSLLGGGFVGGLRCYDFVVVVIRRDRREISYFALEVVSVPITSHVRSLSIAVAECDCAGVAGVRMCLGDVNCCGGRHGDGCGGEWLSARRECGGQIKSQRLPLEESIYVF